MSTEDLSQLADEIKNADPFEALAKSRELASLAAGQFRAETQVTVAAESDPAGFLVESLPLIERVVTRFGRQKGMSLDEIEEFAAEVKIRLVRDDYAVLRAFRGRSSFGVYVASIVNRLFVDSYRTKRRKGRVEASVAAVEDASVNADRTEAARRISAVINSYIDQLAKEDQLIFRLRFDANMSVAHIARALHIEQKLLYRRLYAHFRRLRDMLEQNGISPVDAEGIIGVDTELLDFQLKSLGAHAAPSSRESNLSDAPSTADSE